MNEEMPPAPPDPSQQQNNQEGDDKPNPWGKRVGYLFAIALLAALFYPNLFGSDNRTEIPYQEFREKVLSGEISEAEFNNNNGKIKASTLDGESLKSSGPIELSSEDENLFLGNIPSFEFHTPCLLYTSPSPRDRTRSRMPSSA